MAVIIFILLTALAAAAVFVMWIFGAFIETRTHDSFYYEDLPADFDFEKFKKNRQVIYAITGAITAILAAIVVYSLADQSTFLRTLYVWACIAGGWWYGSNDSPFKHKPDAPPTMLKKQSAEGIGTLFDAVQPTQEVGKPLISYVYDQTIENPPLQFLRVTNEDRGIILGAPGSGKTTYLVTQILDWMESGQSFVATDIKPEIWAILKYNGMFEHYG